MRGEAFARVKHAGSFARSLESSTLMPFLYNTATLRALLARQSSRSGSRCFTRHAPVRQDQSDHKTELRRQARVYADELVGELDLGTTPMRYTSQNSTLTTAEREVFERIYQEAEDRQQNEVESEEEHVERLITAQPTEGVQRSKALEELFERVRPQLKQTFQSAHSLLRPSLDNNSIEAATRAKYEERAKQRQAQRQLLIRKVDISDANQDQPLVAALSQPFEIEEWRKFTVGSSGKLIRQPPKIVPEALAPIMDAFPLAKAAPETAALAKARYLDYERVDFLFTKSETDVEIWRVLEAEVFSRAEELVRALSKPVSPPQEKGKKKKVGRKKLGPEGPVLDAQSADLQPTISPSPPDAPSSDTPAITITIPVPSNPNARSASLPLTLASFRMTYAPLVWAAQRNLRVRFPRSPYAVALLPAIKSLGPISYVLGASTELYDELLLLRWRTYRDPHACADLLAEMLDRGIATSDRTRAVFQNAALEWLDARNQISTKRNGSAKGGDKAGRGKSGRSVVRRVAADLGPDHHWEFKDEDYEAKELSPFRLAWWNLEGVRAGFRRWQALEQESYERMEDERGRMERARRAEQLDEAEADEADVNEIVPAGMVDSGVAIGVEPEVERGEERRAAAAAA